MDFKTRRLLFAGDSLQRSGAEDGVQSSSTLEVPVW